MELTNNTILITGGTSGIGLQFAKQLLERNNTVIITGRNQAKLDLIKKQMPQVQVFQSDVSQPDQITTLHQTVVKRFPELNIIINNAGEMRKINLHDTTYNLIDIAREIEINLSGPIRMIQAFLPHLKTREHAAIINVTSGLALVPFPIAPIYGATKSGLRSYTKSLRVQLKNTDIKVFELVAPSASTPLSDKFEGDVDPKTFMQPDKLVAVAIKGILKDQFEIYPGLAQALKVLSRIAPAFLLKQLSKPVDLMLKK